jgi:hypothetical protein
LAVIGNFQCLVKDSGRGGTEKRVHRRSLHASFRVSKSKEKEEREGGFIERITESFPGTETSPYLWNVLGLRKESEG